MIEKIGQATKLTNQGIVYYFLGDVTIIVKNERITVQSSSQLALLDRLTIPEACEYNIVFDTLPLVDKKGATTASELVEIWILLGFFNILANTGNYQELSVWTSIPGNSIEYTYYTGIEAGNPSGTLTNPKIIAYKTGVAVIVTQTITYNNLDNELTITAS